jgi:hypothetical protein
MPSRHAAHAAAAVERDDVPLGQRVRHELGVVVEDGKRHLVGPAAKARIRRSTFDNRVLADALNPRSSCS